MSKFIGFIGSSILGFLFFFTSSALATTTVNTNVTASTTWTPVVHGVIIKPGDINKHLVSGKNHVKIFQKESDSKTY